jgi:hypothetical protein
MEVPLKSLWGEPSKTRQVKACRQSQVFGLAKYGLNKMPDNAA